MAFLAEETDALDQDIATLIREANLIEAYELLQTILGIKSQAAATTLAESGPDMKQFLTGQIQLIVGSGAGKQRKCRKEEAGSGNERKSAYQDCPGGSGMLSRPHQAIGIQDRRDHRGKGTCILPKDRTRVQTGTS
jgi:hypothetical protein